MPQAYVDYVSNFGAKSNAFPLTIGWSRDSRDSAIAPSSGIMQRVSGEMSLIGDARYARAEYQYQQYIPLNKQFTVALNGELGVGKGFSNRAFPVFKNFYAGGLGSVRGFEQGSLGPIDNTGSYTGGSKKIIGNIELQTPFPGAGNDRTLRLFGFYDIGNVFDDRFLTFKTQELRQSAGVGLSWVSPVGPLRISYGRPLNPKAGDKIQKLQFQIGTAF